MTGPVNFLALTFPQHTVDAAVVETVAEVVRRQDARVLDLLLVVRDEDGTTRTFDVEDHLDEHGLAPLSPEAGALMSDEDVDAIAATLRPGDTLPATS